MSENQVNRKPAIVENIEVAKAFSNYLKTTLGPRGSDKMFVRKGQGDEPDKIDITNDGATIIKKVNSNHHIKSMMTKLVNTQDIEVGDGTTTSIVLAGELLFNSIPLLEDGFKQQKIIDGLDIANQKAKEIYEDISRDYTKEDIKSLITTTLTGKIAFNENIINTLTPCLESMNSKEDIVISKIVGSEGVYVEDGYLLDKEIISKEMPQEKEDANILIFLENLELQTNDATAQQTYEFTQMEDFSEQKSKIYEKWAKDLKSKGVDFIVTTGQVNSLLETWLESENIACIKRVHEEHIDGIKKLTNAKPVKSIRQITENILGKANFKTIREYEEDYILIAKKDTPIKTIVIRGSSDEYVNEVYRSVEDAVKVTDTVKKNMKILTGAGSCELYVANKLREFASSVAEKEQLVIESFASALEQIPKQLSKSSGHDSIELFVKARALNKGNKDIGINVFDGKVEDMSIVVEPLKLKIQVLNNASDICKTLLRIDSIDYQ